MRLTSITRPNAPPRLMSVGIAVAHDRVCAAIRRTAAGQHEQIEAWSRPLVPAATDVTEWNDLAVALEALRDHLAADAPRAHAVILPPVAQIRRIELPRMSDDDVRRVIARDAAKYFPDARSPQLVSARRLASRARGRSAYLVSAAPAAFADLIASAAEQSGWCLVAVSAAYTAWEAAALALWPALRRRPGYLTVTGPGRVEALRFERGSLVLVRRFGNLSGLTRLTSETEPLLASAGREVCAIVGPPEERAAAQEALGTDWHRQLPKLPGAGLLDDGALLAATFANRATHAELIPEREHGRRRMTERRLARTVLSCAAALVVAAAAVELWGAKRELNAIYARRAEIHADVAGVMRQRAAIESARERIDALVKLENNAPQWSGVMAAVASKLPLDAHLTAFRGQADSVFLDGVAERAASVFEAIRQAPTFAGIRANALVRQELDEEQRPVERFGVALRLRADSAAGGSR